MKLINYINFKIDISEEALLVKPIRELYYADKSKDKEVFVSQCSIIYFMADPRSPYQDITDKDLRFEDIKKQEGLPKNYKISKQLQEAIDIYAKLSQTTSSKLFEDAKVAIEKVRRFLREVDLMATDNNGKPIYSVSAITSAIKAIPQLSKDIVETERIVVNELELNSKRRGGDEGKAMFEDGFNVNDD